MKKVLSAVVIACLFIACGCSSSSSSPSSPGSSSGAAEYATFGKTLNDAVPAGLKTGGVNADIAALVMKVLTGECLTSFADCPAMTAAGGSDNQAAEILMRLWGLDYNDECTTASFEDGTCFSCDGCTDNPESSTFIKPTMLADPTACVSTATTAGRYVNFGVDPCFFDSMIGQISNIEECKTVQGGAVDISTAVPWYASWGLAQTVNFSSYYSYGNGGGMWWTINNGPAGNQQYFLSLDSNWLYTGMKDSVNDEFMFIGTGSPAYYQSLPEGYNGVNIAAYTGTLSAIPAQFEAMQVRVQGGLFNYIERLTSNGSYLWYQEWFYGDFPSTPDDVAGVKNSPTGNRCVQIGTSVVTSKYVPLADFAGCVTSFGKTSVEELNQDDNYTLKIIDGQTASSIDFSSALTPTTTTSCLTQ